MPITKPIALRPIRLVKVFSHLYSKTLFKFILFVSILGALLFVIDLFFINVGRIRKFGNVPLETLLFFAILFLTNLFRELGNITSIYFLKNEILPIKINLLAYFFPILVKTPIENRKEPISKKYDLRMGGGKVYFHLIINFLMLILFYIKMSESGLLFILIVTNIINIILSLNPFFTITAGYSLLSNYYNVSNLKESSNSVIISIIKSKQSNKNRFLLYYSILKVIFTLALIGGILFFLVFMLNYLPDLINSFQESGITPFNMFRISMFMLPYFLIYLMFFKKRILI